MPKLMRSMMVSCAFVLATTSATMAQTASTESTSQRLHNVSQANFMEGDATGAPRSLIHNQNASGPDFASSALLFKPYRNAAKTAVKKPKAR